MKGIKHKDVIPKMGESIERLKAVNKSLLEAAKAARDILQIQLAEVKSVSYFPVVGEGPILSKLHKAIREAEEES